MMPATTIGEAAAGSGRDGPVRCLIIAPAPLDESWVGGIANFIRGFVRHMPDDFEVDICGVAVGDQTGGSGWQKIELAGRQVRFLPVARISTPYRAGRVPVKAMAIAGLLRARSKVVTAGRVVQVHSPAMDLALIGRPAPLIRVVHNAPENLASDDGGSRWRHFGLALRAAENLTFRRAERVLFVDRPTFELCVARGGPSAAKMRYLPNGVDTALFRPRDDAERAGLRDRLAADLSLPAADPWLLFVGRLDRQKDPVLLIRTFAAARASDGLERARLLIVGEGPLRAQTEQLAHDLELDGVTHFLGPWPHEGLAELMSAADALLLPSAYEGAPFVVLEALAAGLPVVSTRVGDVPLLVAHRTTGWLAEQRSAVDLVAGIRWVLEQRRAEIGARCAASMEPYRLQAVLAPFYEEHRRLAGATGRARGTSGGAGS